MVDNKGALKGHEGPNWFYPMSNTMEKRLREMDKKAMEERLATEYCKCEEQAYIMIDTNPPKCGRCKKVLPKKKEYCKCDPPSDEVFYTDPMLCGQCWKELPKTKGNRK